MPCSGPYITDAEVEKVTNDVLKFLSKEYFIFNFPPGGGWPEDHSFRQKAEESRENLKLTLKEVIKSILEQNAYESW